MRLSILWAIPLTIALCDVPAQAQQAGETPLTVKIGVLSDMSGLYADVGGPGSVAAANMAVEDFNPASHDMKVEIVSADHQNKPDIGSAIARRWFDVEQVNAIADVPNSGVALAVSNVTREKNRVFLISGAADSDLTDKQCSPNTVHWTYDTWALAHGTGGAIVRQGGKTWFFITADYAFGHALERDTAAVVKAAGGKVLGAVRHPLNTSDFSSYLLQAQSSKAQVIGLANAGGDTINAVKQAAEFRIVQGGQRLAGLLVFLYRCSRPRVADRAGLDADDRILLGPQRQDPRIRETLRCPRRRQDIRQWFRPACTPRCFTISKAVAKVGSPTDGTKVVEAMKATHYDDPLFGDTVVRQDGRAIHALYLVEVKKPTESKSPYDYFKVLATIPADQAFRPLADEKGTCGLVKAASR